GLTIGMIGLIMFVLSLQSAMNANFAAAFAGDESRGGFDVRAIVNTNNRSEDFVATLEEGNQAPDVPQPVDVSRIAGVGGVLRADQFEVDIEDPEWVTEDPAERDPEDQFRSYPIMGLD